MQYINETLIYKIYQNRSRNRKSTDLKLLHVRTLLSMSKLLLKAKYKKKIMKGIFKLRFLIKEKNEGKGGLFNSILINSSKKHKITHTLGFVKKTMKL